MVPQVEKCCVPLLCGALGLGILQYVFLILGAFHVLSSASVGLILLALLVLFGIDVALGDPATGQGWPFMGFSKTMDIGFIVAALMLAYISLTTYRELP